MLSLATHMAEEWDVDYRKISQTELCDYVAFRYWHGNRVPLRLNGVAVTLGPLPERQRRRAFPSSVREVLGSL